MQFDPTQGSTASSSTLKRTLAQQAFARKVPKIESEQTPSGSPTPVFSPEFSMPNSSSSSAHPGSRSRGGSFGRSSRAPPPAFKGGKSKGKGGSNSMALSRLPMFEGPSHDEAYIASQFAETYAGVPPPKPVYLGNPKGSLSNWMNNAYNKLPTYQSNEGRSEEGRALWRYDHPALGLVSKLTILQNHSGGFSAYGR